ncbi:hypothetical protein Cflav_PD2482 [Pedosphaera parvula Ellin514]|uniref:Uncharacterized protein n=1 Tax=Pedosphaera parvula (strain Ellin514) TaxID=320771 RepID=B9XKT2_PEDPL|nr:hypothetical protein Cflav_PD2482 [Pedosphaera parvula Ellin514]
MREHNQCLITWLAGPASSRQFKAICDWGATPVGGAGGPRVDEEPERIFPHPGLLPFQREKEITSAMFWLNRLCCANAIVGSIIMEASSESAGSMHFPTVQIMLAAGSDQSRKFWNCRETGKS